MKIRTGFVSNSSSSSFVIALPNKPKSAKELQEMLFPPNHEFASDNYYCDEHDNEFCNCVIAKKIYEDICGTEPMSTKDINDWHEEYNVDKFYKEHKNKIIYELSYGDHDGSLEYAIEHGNAFEHVPHIVINCH